MNTSIEVNGVARLVQYTLIDSWTLAYTVVTSLALIWHWSNLSLALQLSLPLAHGLILYCLYSMPKIRKRGAAGQFLGNWYPYLLILIFYSEVGQLNQAGGRSFDEPIQLMESWIFGSQVAIEWIRAWPDPLFSWLANLSYSLYYFIVVGTPMLVSRVVSHEAGQKLLLMALIAFYVSYTVFLVMPVAGPLYQFPQVDNIATQTGAAVIVSWLLKVGDAWGSAFPSAHVAVTTILTVGSFMEHKRIGLFLLPLMIMLILATVYAQIHYAVDALAGLVLAGLILVFRRQLTHGLYQDVCRAGD